MYSLNKFIPVAVGAVIGGLVYNYKGSGSEKKTRDVGNSSFEMLARTLKGAAVGSAVGAAGSFVYEQYVTYAAIATVAGLFQNLYQNCVAEADQAVSDAYNGLWEAVDQFGAVAQDAADCVGEMSESVSFEERNLEGARQLVRDAAGYLKGLVAN